MKKIVIDNVSIEDVSTIYDIFNDYLNNLYLDMFEDKKDSAKQKWYTEHYNYILGLKNKIEVINAGN